LGFRAIGIKKFGFWQRLNSIAQVEPQFFLLHIVLFRHFASAALNKQKRGSVHSQEMAEGWDSYPHIEQITG